MKRTTTSWNLAYGPEKVAYYVVAKWMMNVKHPVWMEIVGKKLSDEELKEKAYTQDSWVPAVSSMYIIGHLNTKLKILEDPKKILRKGKFYLLFETSMSGAGIEGYSRLYNPLHMISLCKHSGTDWTGVVFDPEHLLGSGLDPLEIAKKIPNGDGKFVKVVHLGYPTPKQPAHMGIPLGSRAQLYLYRILYELRKKGFRDGYIIFERAAESQIKQSILAIRKIVEYLEKDVPPENLPMDFYGISLDNEEFKRQLAIINEHAYEPLKGLLSVPEEEHTFLSGAAKDRMKLEEWRKEKYR
ncbi:MAG: hypothetical protein GXO63_00865 [Candidatus Micrarchaeota archaeon]|nr:hypothetical protein [Candidatus Micrarchaeota archaeon]